MSFLRHQGLKPHEGFLAHQGFLRHQGFLDTSVVSPPINLIPPAISIEYTATPGSAEFEVTFSGVWEDADTVTGEWYVNGIPTGFTSTSYSATGLLPGDEVYWFETATNSAGTSTVSSNSFTADERILAPVLYLDASIPTQVRNPGGLPASNGDKVAAWNDLSLAGNHFIQTTDANRPIYNTATGAISFDAVNDYLSRTHFTFQDHAVFMLMRFRSGNGGSASGDSIPLTTGPTYFIGRSSAGANQIQVGDYAANLAPYPRTTVGITDHLFAFTAEFNGTGFDVSHYLDGNLMATSSGSNSVPGEPAMIGGNFFGNFFADIEAYEFLILDRIPTGSEFLSTSDYLKSKKAIP